MHVAVSNKHSKTYSQGCTLTRNAARPYFETLSISARHLGVESAPEAQLATDMFLQIHIKVSTVCHCERVPLCVTCSCFDEPADACTDHRTSWPRTQELLPTATQCSQARMTAWAQETSEHATQRVYW